MPLRTTRRQNIILLVLAAILLRLALMPFFMHMDMLSEYRRINFAFENSEFYPGFNRLTIFYIEMLFYSITHLFVVQPEVVLYLPDPIHSTATTTTHFIFTGDNYVFRHIFLFKLPYLIFDLLCGLLTWRYFEGHKLQTFALAFWFFNPVTIYATYFFGRFEVISLFFLIATVLALKQQKLITASIIFGLALNCREINLIFVPALMLSFMHLWKRGELEINRLGLCILIVVLATFFPYLLEWIFSLNAAFTRESNLLEVDKGVNAFFSVKYGVIYPFFLVATISYIFLLRKSDSSAAHLFVVSALAVILPFFLGDFRSAHYFAWGIPFLVLACYHTQGLKWPLVLLMTAWTLHWLFNPTGAHFTPLLATPINEAFFGFGSFSQNWNSTFLRHSLLNAQTLKGVFIALASAVMLLILFQAVIRQRR